MALAVFPLVLSAAGGYLLLKHGVILGFQDVAARQRFQVEPTQRLRLLLWDAVPPLDEFVDEGDPTRSAAYRALRQQIEASFAAVHNAIHSEPEPASIVERAREEWSVADTLATQIISAPHKAGDPHTAEAMDEFDGHVAAAVDRLGAVSDALATDIRADHDAALLAFERAEWLVGIAAAVSILLILAGVVLIGRMMTLSVDRLVVGAGRFAAGDREHRIEIQVPPELRRVADEFNRMIVRIHKAEEALGNLARKDGLTGLSNRRAFDEALREAMFRIDRLGEGVAMLLLDVDHFKKVNDTHGHLIGDEVLRSIADTLSNDVRPFDGVFRVGGEEFAVLLYGADVTNARAIAERLREATAAKVVTAGSQQITATVSIGVATAAKSSTPTSLVADADAALYRAKSEGRNRVLCCGWLVVTPEWDRVPTGGTGDGEGRTPARGPQGSPPACRAPMRCAPVLASIGGPAGTSDRATPRFEGLP